MAQASSDDEFLVAQGLEALAVLGEQHGIRTTPQIDALLTSRAGEAPSISRKAFSAAMGVGSRALEGEAIRRLAGGEASWEVLRYAGEWPSHALGHAILSGWKQIPERLLDEALLTICSMPAANAQEAREFGRRAMEAARDPAEPVRFAALIALRWWVPIETADICAQALTDVAPPVRRRAAELLAALEPARFLELVDELADSAPEAASLAPQVREAELQKALKKRRP
jgi:hypothetical protein